MIQDQKKKKEMKNLCFNQNDSNASNYLTDNLLLRNLGLLKSILLCQNKRNKRPGQLNAALIRVGAAITVRGNGRPLGGWKCSSRHLYPRAHVRLRVKIIVCGRIDASRFADSRAVRASPRKSGLLLLILLEDEVDWFE